MWFPLDFHHLFNCFSKIKVYKPKHLNQISCGSCTYCTPTIFLAINVIIPDDPFLGWQCSLISVGALAPFPAYFKAQPQTDVPTQTVLAHFAVKTFLPACGHCAWWCHIRHRPKYFVMRPCLMLCHHPQQPPAIRKVLWMLPLLQLLQCWCQSILYIMWVHFLFVINFILKMYCIECLYLTCSYWMWR